MGEPVLVDLNEESDSEDQDFGSWEPDPVDADPCKYTTQNLHFFSLPVINLADYK